MKKTLLMIIGMATLIFPSMAMAAPATINVERNPGPPQTVLNDGSGKVAYGGSIAFDGTGTPYAYVLRVLRDVDGNGLANENPANDICRVNGEADGSPTAANMTGAVSPFVIPNGECAIPGNAEVGRYLVAIHFYITDPDPLIVYRTDSDARATFYVSSPAESATVIVKKVEDMNGNGVVDTGERGLSGWEFTITPPANPSFGSTGEPFTAQTDVNGEVRLVGVPPGDYTVTETAQTGWVAISPAELRVNAPVNVVTEANFLNARPASVCGFVREDTNDDGKNTVLDQGFGGLIMQLLGLATGNQNTKANGEYCFESLNPGEYEIRLQSCGEDMVIIDDADGVTTGEPGSIRVTLTSGQDLKEQNVLCVPVEEEITEDPPVDVDVPEEPEVVENKPKVTG